MTTDISPLSCLNLTAGYDVPVVHDVDFQLEPGVLTVLIGANGCGKSTLLKGLSRTLPIESGQVLLEGHDIHALPSKHVAKKLGLLPQTPIAPEGLTVRELVALGRFPYQSIWQSQSAEDHAIIEESMEMAQVENLADKMVDELSGGQRQRCWIAMTLAQQTNVLLLDEPTTYLDLKVQVELMQLLSELTHQHGRTIAVVLHELNLAVAFADYLVMMKSGRIAHQGSPQAVFTEENLMDVFNLSARVMFDPESGRPHCIPRLNSTVKRSKVA